MSKLGWKEYVECEMLVVCIHKYYYNVHILCTSKQIHMVAAPPPPPPPPILGRDLKISGQNNWGGPEQKIKFGGELNLRRT